MYLRVILEANYWIAAEVPPPPIAPLVQVYTAVPAKITPASLTAKYRVPVEPAVVG